MAARQRVAIAGLGSVGREVAHRVIRDLSTHYELTAVAARREGRARKFLTDLSSRAEVVPVEELADHADLVVECAPADVFPAIAEPVITIGHTLIVLSVGALLDHWHIVGEAERTGARILVPTGALLALDAVQGAAQGTIHSVRMVSRKPPAGLVGAPFVEERGIDLAGLAQPMCLFEGTAREAVRGFPANLNVAVALSLAGVGPDRTDLELWADPALDRNTHHIVVESDSARLEFSIANVPSDNASTGRITALSVVALLRKLVAPLRIGT